MLCLSGFELYSRWVPLSISESRQFFRRLCRANRNVFKTRFLQLSIESNFTTL